jgi:signal transduction histidine kinase
MKWNLQLLELQQRGITRMVAIIISLLFYFFLVLGLIAWFSYKSQLDNIQIQKKLERIEKSLELMNLVDKKGNEELRKIIDDLFLDTTIYSLTKNKYYSHYISQNEWKMIKKSEFSYFDWFQYFGVETIIRGESVRIYIREPAQSPWELLFKGLFFLGIISPLIFGLILFITRTMIHKAYDSFRDIVWNLENFSSNVSHEFKTGLAEIISSLQLARYTKEYEGVSEDAISSAKRLNIILDSLSILARFVNSDYRKHKTNIIALFEDMIHGFYHEIEDKQLNIVKNYNPHSKVYSLIDREAFLLCFSNIFKNAIRYSYAWWKIEVTISEQEISIKDQWVGIEKENMEKIFNRYFRENYSSEWQGIGLPMVKTIADRYDWKVVVESEKGEYTLFKIIF